jgi:hypothetical protein
VRQYSSKPKRLLSFDYAAKRTYFVTMCIKDRVEVFGDPIVAQLAVDVIMRYRAYGRVATQTNGCADITNALNANVKTRTSS